MRVDGNITVKDIVRGMPASAQIFEKLGIDFCCGGARSLQDACQDVGIRVDQVVQKLEGVARTPNPESQAADWNTATLSSLVSHIVERHHATCRQQLEWIGPLLAKVVKVHGANHPELGQVQPIFAKLSEELSMHMMKEEHVLFPFITNMEDAASRKANIPDMPFGTVQQPVKMMMLEHDEAGAELKEIRKLTNAFELPPGACGSYRNLYDSLREFEQDLHQHIYLENYVLFPRTIALEETAEQALS
ncbi:MAG TPA: iron-sulfur cluster repair di-iron protein [Terriglobia bacterium]|nr:iron-sulfur cluster repair di-iron protein [Terriglobia bacterium]